MSDLRIYATIVEYDFNTIYSFVSATNAEHLLNGLKYRYDSLIFSKSVKIDLKTIVLTNS